MLMNDITIVGVGSDRRSLGNKCKIHSIPDDFNHFPNVPILHGPYMAGYGKPHSEAISLTF